MIIAKIFDQYCVDINLTSFISSNKIARNQIISISFAVDSEAPRRLDRSSVQQILLVWDDGK